MDIYKKINFIILFFLFQISLSAQDSLYLITTILGESQSNPIYYSYGLGDVNGDGYDDFAVKYLYVNYFDIYFGGELLNLDKKYRFYTPKGIESDLTFPMGLWDINNDGIDDFYFEGYTQDSIYKYHFYQYFYLGKQFLDTIPFVVMNEIGSIVTKGDMNGDGYIDFAASKKEYGKSKIFLFLGADTLSTSPSLIFENEMENDGFGSRMSLSGDINGDGFNDLLALNYFLNGSNFVSNIYIYFGKVNISSKPDLILEIPFSPGDTKSIGDFNGDKYDDFILQESGKTRLYLGSKNFKGDNYYEFYSQSSTFGHGVGCLDDINNDGFNDFAISDYRKVEIFLGNNTIDYIPDFSVVGQVDVFGNFGSYISNLGDINNDGFNEFCVLEENYPDFDHKRGILYIYSMKDFIVGIKDLMETHPFFELSQNYPNPFNPSTTINYQIKETGNVRIKIYDALGREITTLVNEIKQPGNYNVTFDADNHSSGIYFVRMQANEYRATKKIILAK